MKAIKAAAVQAASVYLDLDASITKAAKVRARSCWCPLPGSNRDALWAQDFKSCASTNSAKGAWRPSSAGREKGETVFSDPLLAIGCLT